MGFKFSSFFSNFGYTDEEIELIHKSGIARLKLDDIIDTQLKLMKARINRLVLDNRLLVIKVARTRIPANERLSKFKYLGC